MSFKPMLACDADLDKLRFPLIAQPKIDGVRALNFAGKLMARSMKPIRNNYTRNFFSLSFLHGIDGEMAAATVTCADLCRLTTSATSSIEGEPFVLWHVFDYFGEGAEGLPYKERLELLKVAVESIPDDVVRYRVRLIPSLEVHNREELEKLEAGWLANGYEGVILRDPNGKFKQGRSTVREGGLLRIKRFTESTAKVIGIVEGQANENEAQTNELGNTFRSTHQENMVPNGLIGNLQCEAQETIKFRDRVVIEKGQLITVSPGNMDHAARKYYFENQNLILNQVIEFKFFPVGIKDKPRFPTFVKFSNGE